MDRSANMRAIRGKDMLPELKVRSLVHRLGYRFRLHRKDLPGKPDLVFGPRRKVIFVHGCFWHSPDKNRSYPKIESGILGTEAGAEQNARWEKYRSAPSGGLEGLGCLGVRSKG